MDTLNDNLSLSITEIEDASVPVLIEKQFDELKLIEEQIKKARSKANAAKQSADEAREKSAGFGKKKAAIESLQDASVDLASAQITASEAQEMTFENQKKLANISKRLFDLGISNIAQNRFVVREIELRLKNASEEELSDLAREEMMNVVRQLKAQEDIMLKQAKLSQTVKIHGERLDNQDIRSESLKESIDEGVAHDEIQDDILKQHTEKDLEHDRLLEESMQRDLGHDLELNRQANKDKEHDKRLDESDAHDTFQDNQISECLERIKTLEANTVELEQSYANLEGKTSALSMLLSDKENEIVDIKKKWKRLEFGTVGAVIISIIALVAAIIQYIK